MQLAGVFDTIKKVIQIIKRGATGISPVAPLNYWELHIISLCSVSCNLMILLFSCTLFCNDYIFFYKNRM